MLKGQLAHWDPNKLTIKRAPRVKQAYWIAMVEDSSPPEFSGYHPGIIIRACSSLNEATETVSFVPITSTPPVQIFPYIYPLLTNPNPVDQRPVWAVCNHIYTVRLSRLELYIDVDRKHVVPSIDDQDTNGIFDAMLAGFTAFRSHANKAAEARIGNIRQTLEAEFDERVEAALNIELERLTAPAATS